MNTHHPGFPLVAILALFASPCLAQQPNTHKTLLFKNATIWTGDDNNRIVSAIAIKGNIITYVGNNTSGIKADSIIDLKGRMIVPGFIDNHTHFLTGGYQLNAVNFRSAKTKQDFINILRDYLQTHPGDSWIEGGDWDHEAWGGDLPAKEWIDSITGNRPLFVTRYDLHMGLANSAALAIAGVDKNTISPKGGEIVKDPHTGEPTGILKDAAANFIYRKIPTPSEKDLDEYLNRATNHAWKNGVTQVHDVGSYGGWTDLETYRRAHRKNELGIRVYSFVPLGRWHKMVEYIYLNGKGDDMIRWGALKGFVDGSLGSTTAWFYHPYLDKHESTGLVMGDTLQLKKWILAADSAGLHVAVHAIGDRANDLLLNIFEDAGKINGKKDRRFRIEHAQHLSGGAIKKFSLLNVIPSMQPYHAIDDGRWAAKRLEEDRLKRTYAFNSLLNANARLTFGSDWTVAPLTPLEGMYAAVTRSTLDGKNKGGWFPEQKITLEQALKCYTVNNAYAGFQENKVGKLKKGMLADFVVLSENLFKIPEENIKDVKVLMTVINGKIVYDGR